MLEDRKFSIEDGARNTNFFLKGTGESTADFFKGAKKIGSFWTSDGKLWVVKFGTCGEMWKGIGEQYELLQAAGRFIFFSEKRKKLPAELDDNHFKSFYGNLILRGRYPNLDDDLLKQQARRDHSRLLMALDKEIAKVSDRFAKL